MDSLERSFKCQQCGECCRWPGHVLLTEEDIARMAVAAGLSEEEFIARYTTLAANRRQLSLTDAPDGSGSCVLLKDNRCLLYEARPAQCRDFPYGWRVAEGCPALDALKETSAV
jgi:Fe-S-cluster containining protein